MFHLTKWYCDCVSPEGGVFLGYWAKLSWGPFTIPYVASIYKPASEPAIDRSALRSCPPPVEHDGRLDWACRPLGIHGSWIASAPPYRRVLLNDAIGSITWECERPAAQARVELAGAPPITGDGYAERLTLSVHPRHLPFDELRWGRFVSAADVLTWIDWRGSANRRWVFHNGIEVSGAIVGDASIQAAGAGVLELSACVPLREGRLAATALRKIPGAGRWLLRGVPAAHERKWLARGTFRSGTHTSEGWAIHEVVRIRG